MQSPNIEPILSFSMIATASQCCRREALETKTPAFYDHSMNLFWHNFLQKSLAAIRIYIKKEKENMPSSVPHSFKLYQNVLSFKKLEQLVTLFIIFRKRFFFIHMAIHNKGLSTFGFQVWNLKIPGVLVFRNVTR